jgi:hypothetical protein
VINNGVDHVDDIEPDLPSLLQGVPDGDAQDSRRFTDLTPVADSASSRHGWITCTARPNEEPLLI